MENYSKLDIFGNKTIDYVFNCLSKFNRNESHLLLRTSCGSTFQGIAISRILENEFGVRIVNTYISNLDVEGMCNTCLKIVLQMPNQSNEKNSKFFASESNLMDYTIYHLLLDNILVKYGELEIKTKDTVSLLTVVESENGRIFKKNITKEIDSEFHDSLGESLYRCGLLFPQNWLDIAKRLSSYDDIILGIDTNVLFNKIISEHLLPSLSLINPKEYVYTPNWILFVIPSAVMHEIEEGANIRNKGKLTKAGRVAYRALQEILELGHSIDLPGISLVIVGEANPILDTKVELKELRKDINNSQKRLSDNYSLPQIEHSSSGDMIIRDQFKKFLRQIDFHKGIYFLTADKSNAALSRTEGLHPVYFKFPWGEYNHGTNFREFEINVRNEENIIAEVPIGKLIYELAVQFGDLTLKWPGGQIRLSCDLKGENIDSWTFRQLYISMKDEDILIKEYTGIIDLNKAKTVGENLINKFMGLEDIS